MFKSRAQIFGLCRCMTVPVIPAWNTIVPVRRVALQIQEKMHFILKIFVIFCVELRKDFFSTKKKNNSRSEQPILLINVWFNIFTYTVEADLQGERFKNKIF